MQTCPTCGTSNQDAARFCANCGTALAARAPEGERKQVTVLFADVVGSTGLAEKLDPEELVEIMNGAFAFMGVAVNRYGGTVERLMGDSVLAFFGARQSHEDDAERAMRAGLEIRDEAGKYAEKVRSRFGVGFQVRVGINTGLVVAGRVGTELGEEFTTTGDAPNVAARLQAAATPGTVLISASTHRLAHHAFELKSLGALEVKGKSAPVEAYEVLSARAVPGKSRGLEGQGLSSPLVGRAAEIGLLREKVKGLQTGAGAVVAVVGEAGLGKSRLIAELRESLPRAIWYEGRALSYGQALPYHAWQPLVHRMIGVDEAPAPAAVREKLRAQARTSNVPAAALPYLEMVLGVAEGPAPAEGEKTSQAVASAVLDFIRAVLGASEPGAPRVLVLDDLQWADSASLELVAQVAALTTAVEPLLFVAMMRPDKKAPSWALLDRLRGSLDEGFTQIELMPLDASASRELLGNLLHVKDLPDSIRSRILERSEGNPFYLEEVLRSLIDSGHIVNEGEHWRATREIEGVTIPDTLAGVLSSRIDRLPEQARRVAQTASVLGREFPFDTLEVMCRGAPGAERIEHVLPHLLTLTYEELVRRKPDALRVYKFKHALTREAAYGLLLRARRRQLHGQAAAILERELETSGRREELAPLVGLHYFEAGDWRKAASYLAEAGRATRRLFALREEGEHWERVLTALDQVPDPDPELYYEAVDKLFYVRVGLDEVDALVGPEPERAPSPWFVRAERMARERGDKAKLARLLSWIANVYFRVGRGSKGSEQIRESEKLALELGDERLMMLPLFISSMTLNERNPAKAAEQFTHVLELARANGDHGVEAHALGVQAVAFARMGEFDKAREAIASALEIAPHSGSRVKEADAHIAVAMAYNDMGEYEKATLHAKIGADKAADTSAIECACAGYFEMGKSQLARRELDGALAQFQRSLSYGDATGAAGWEGYFNRIGSHAALTKFEKGAHDAVQELQTTVDNARKNNDAFGVAEASENLARALMQIQRTAEAATYLNAAMDYYRNAGMATYLTRAQALQAQLPQA